MKGFELLRALILHTGLPEAWLEKRVTTLLEKRGLSVENLSLEDLREFTADLLQECVQESLKEGPADSPGPN